MTSPSRSLRPLIESVAVVILSIAAFYPSLASLYYRWFEPQTYYSHAPLVIIAFAFLFKKRLDMAPPTEGRRSYLGGGTVILVALSLELFGVWQDINIAKSLAFYLFIIGNSVFFLGGRFVVRNWDIYLYLLLAIPIPSIFLTYLTFHLKLFSSVVSAAVLSIFYESTQRYGNILVIKDHSIAVTSACSGLQNLFGMFSLVWLMALLQTNRVVAIVDILLAAPLAILANIMRIVLVSVLVVEGHGKFALEDWHEEIGLVMFCIAFVALSLFNRISLKKFKTENRVSILTLLGSKARFMPVYAAILIAVLMTSVAISSTRSTGDGLKSPPPARESIPKQFGNWVSEEIKIEEWETEILGTRDVLMRAFVDSRESDPEMAVFLYLLNSWDDSRKVGHPPELCFRGEGFGIASRDKIELRSGASTIRANRMIFAREDERILVYYWFRVGGENTDSYLAHQLSTVFDSRGGRGASMIRLSVDVGLNDVEAGEKLMKRFVLEGMPGILKALSHAEAAASRQAP